MMDKNRDPTRGGAPPESALESFQDTIDGFLEGAAAETVYGDPIRHGEDLIIPAAEALAVMGFGIGAGYGRDGEDDVGGGGGGGGGRTFSRPVAVIVASPDGVRIDPVMDITKIALAALTAGAFMLGIFLRLLNPRKTLEELSKGKWQV